MNCRTEKSVLFLFCKKETMMKIMNLPLAVTQEELLEVLLNITPIRPVMIWGAPVIAKEDPYI